VAGKSPVNHENIMGKSWKTMGNPRKKHGKTWENHGKIHGKMKVLMENNIYT